MNSLVTTLVPSFLIGSSSFLRVTRTTIKSWFEIGKIKPGTEELAAPEHFKKFPLTYKGRNVVTTLVHSFLDVSFSFLLVTRTTIKA